MSDADALEFLGYLFVAYTTGWIGGFLFLTFKQVSDKL